MATEATDEAMDAPADQAYTTRAATAADAFEANGTTLRGTSLLSSGYKHLGAPLRWIYDPKQKVATELLFASNTQNKD